MRDKAQPRSLRALEAVILARQGDRRKSVLVIRDAFPALGGPFQATVPEEARRLYYPLEYQEHDPHLGGDATGCRRTWCSGIIRQESAFDTHAQSWAGARGLMQLMPATARELAAQGRPPLHARTCSPIPPSTCGWAPPTSARCSSMFDGNVELSLAGYNGGPYRIKRLWKESGKRRARPLPREPGPRGVQDLRQADPGALGQLPPALSHGRVRQRPAQLPRPPSPALLPGLLPRLRAAAGGPDRPHHLRLPARRRGRRAGRRARADAEPRRADAPGRLGGPGDRAVELGLPAMASLFTGLRPWQHQVLQRGRAACSAALHPAGGPAGRWATRPAASPARPPTRKRRLRPGVRRLRGARQGRRGRQAARARSAAAGGSSGSTSPSRRRPTSAAPLFDDRLDDRPARPPEAGAAQPARALLRSRRRRCRRPGGGCFWAMYRFNVAWADERLGRLLAGPAAERRVGPHAPGGDLRPTARSSARRGRS